MKVRAALMPFVEILLGLRPPRESVRPVDDAAIARELFCDGFDSLDIAHALGLSEWQVLPLLARARDVATIGETA